jgi:hypothetical protein
MTVLDHTADAAPADFEPASDSADPDEQWDAGIESDGLTLDTELGPVDLVAVQHALWGLPVSLTVAEQAWIALPQGYGVRRRAAIALGINYPRLLAALALYRAMNGSHGEASASQDTA